MLDVVVIGGGPAGMSAALSSGRGKNQVMLIDEEKPRNAVTKHTHGFLTNDGVSPSTFRERGRADLLNYPNINIKKDRVTSIEPNEEESFVIHTQAGKKFVSHKIILTTGLKETLPNVERIQEYYGKSIFSCPFCDGWEMKDQALILIIENAEFFHSIKLLKNWTDDLIVATNGYHLFNNEQKQAIRRNHIRLIEEKIDQLKGENGQLNAVTFKDGTEIKRTGGFCGTHLENRNLLFKKLGLETDDAGYVLTDRMGKTNIKGIYAAGEITGPSQLIVSAGQGHMAGIGTIMDNSEEKFLGL